MGIGTNVLLVAGGAVAATIISKMRRGETITQIIGSIPLIDLVFTPQPPPMEPPTDPIVDPVTGEILDPTIILT